MIKVTLYQEILASYKTSIINKYRPMTVENHLCLMTMFFKGVNKPVGDITREDIDQYLATLKPSTCEIMKSRIRSFFKWYYKTGKKLPEFISDLETNANALKPTKGDEVVLTPDQIERVINDANNLQHKAIIETFIVTGIRNGELCDLTVGDIKEEGNTVWVTVKRSRKTQKPRRIPIISYPGNPCARYPKFLMMWEDVHPFKNNPSAPLFGKISPDTVGRIVSKVGSKAGITRKLTPHDLRHTGASYDGSHLTEQNLCVKYGWYVGSAMPRRYCHINEKQLEQSINRIAGITEETKDIPRYQLENRIEKLTNALEQLQGIVDSLIQKDLQREYEKSMSAISQKVRTKTGKTFTVNQLV
jgi:integrase